MDYEIFSYNNIRHILYISYHDIICSRRVLTEYIYIHTQIANNFSNNG
jgi:hypothetical protein